MKLHAPAFAALSLALSFAADRPYYGGTLRVQLSGSAPAFDVSVSTSPMRERVWWPLVYETLVAIDERGDLRPCLATSWTADPDRKRWRFTLRDRVVLHDGTPLTPASAAALLKTVPGVDAAPTPRGVQISSATPFDPRVLSSAAWFPTGPFRRVEGKLVAFEQHWLGRPFLDAIEFLPPRPGPPVLSAAEVWEIPAGVSRRSVPDGVTLWSSALSELLAIDTTGLDPSVASSLSLSIDREMLTSVLTQRRGEPAGSLLPAWMSGYSFLFPHARDLTRARELLGGRNPGPIHTSFDASDGLARLVADRIAVNARDAGLTVSSKPASAAVRLVRIPIGPDPVLALRRMAADLAVDVAVSNDPDLLYGAERMLLESGKLVPLMHLPVVFAIHPKVHGASGSQRLPLESMWVTP